MTHEEIIQTRAYQIGFAAGMYYQDHPNVDSWTAFDEGAEWAWRRLLERVNEYLKNNTDLDASERSAFLEEMNK